MKGKKIVVWFSCGAASAVAAKLTIDKYGQDNEVIILNNPIKDEHDDNQRFLRDVESWLGVKIEHISSSEYPSQSCYEVWEKRQYMSGRDGAPCTMILKKRARQEWENKNDYDFLVMGFTFEEKHRHDNFIVSERPNLLPVLIEAKMTKAQCFLEVKKAGIKLPEMYDLGYPNANCIGCVKATSPTYWNHVRKHHPIIFKSRAKQSRRIGCKLVKVKGKRIYLDRLHVNVTGRPMRDMNFECGLFCEEPTPTT